MNATELYLKDGRSSGVFYCGTCRRVHMGGLSADKCCAPLHCERCGRESTPEEKFLALCVDCRHAKNRERWEAYLASAEEVVNYADWIFTEEVSGNQDGYFESVEALAEECEDDDIGIPEWVFCCHRNPFVMDSQDAIEAAERNMGLEECEDYDPTYRGLAEFTAACEAFTAANKDVCTWDADYKRKVRVMLGDPERDGDENTK